MQDRFAENNCHVRDNIQLIQNQHDAEAHRISHDSETASSL